MRIKVIDEVDIIVEKYDWRFSRGANDLSYIEWDQDMLGDFTSIIYLDEIKGFEATSEVEDGDVRVLNAFLDVEVNNASYS